MATAGDVANEETIGSKFVEMVDIVSMGSKVKYTEAWKFETLPDSSPFKSKSELFVTDYKNGDYKEVFKGYYYVDNKYLINEEGNTSVYLGYGSCIMQWVAIKIILFSKNEEAANITKTLKMIERRVLKAHPNIGEACKYGIKDLKNKEYCIIMPLYDCSLTSFLREEERTFSVKRKLIEELFIVINHIHTKKVLHRHITPDVIMITSLCNPVLKLTDFSNSKISVESPETKPCCDTPEWLPPKSKSEYIHESFVTCMMIVYIVSNGKHPFIELPEDIEDMRCELEVVYKNKITIPSSIKEQENRFSHLLEFLDSKFDEFYAHFVNHQEYDDKLSVASLKESIEDILHPSESESNQSLDMPEGKQQNSLYGDHFPDNPVQYKDFCKKFADGFRKNKGDFTNIGGYFYSNDFRIGKGGSAITFLGYPHDILDQWVAIKRSSLEPGIKNVTDLNEIEKLRKFSKGHDSIVEYLHAKRDQNHSYLITVLYDYTLKHYLDVEKPSFKNRCLNAQQLLSGISYLHHDCNPSILHKDLKPTNVMIDSKLHIKIIDFEDSVEYIPGSTKRNKGAGDPLWLPPGIKLAKTIGFTNIHEVFVACMLTVYILSNGEHPFIHDLYQKIEEGREKGEEEYEKALEDAETELENAYKDNKKICVLLDFDALKFFDKWFQTLYSYCKLPREERKEFQDNISISVVQSRFKELYSIISPNFTRGRRYAVCVSCSNQRKAREKIPSGSTVLKSGVPNVAVLQSSLKKCNFKVWPTVEDMSKLQLLEIMNEIGKEVRTLDYRDSMYAMKNTTLWNQWTNLSKPIHIILYIYAHSYHDTTNEDTWMEIDSGCDKKEKGVYIKQLINEINECFPYEVNQEKRQNNVKIILFFEGCRKPEDNCTKLPVTDASENVLRFNSVRKGEISHSYNNNDRYATPWVFCSELAENLKPGNKIKDCFIYTQMTLENVAITKQVNEKGEEVSLVTKDNSPREVERPIPELELENIDETLFRFIL